MAYNWQLQAGSDQLTGLLPHSVATIVVDITRWLMTWLIKQKAAAAAGFTCKQGSVLLCTSSYPVAMPKKMQVFTCYNLSENIAGLSVWILPICQIIGADKGSLWNGGYFLKSMHMSLVCVAFKNKYDLSHHATKSFNTEPWPTSSLDNRLSKPVSRNVH